MRIDWLEARHVYQLPNGWRFVAAPDGERYMLSTRAEWRSRTPAALVVHADDVVTLQGLDTGWRVSDLRDTGPIPLEWHRVNRCQSGPGHGTRHRADTQTERSATCVSQLSPP